jgi:hypothetical protein
MLEHTSRNRSSSPPVKLGLKPTELITSKVATTLSWHLQCSHLDIAPLFASLLAPLIDTLIEDSGKSSELRNLICWRKSSVLAGGLQSKLRKTICEIRYQWALHSRTAALSAPGWPVPRLSNSFELSLVVISRIVSSLIRPVAFRSASVRVVAGVNVLAGLLAVAAPPCHPNAVDESQVTKTNG